MVSGSKVLSLPPSAFSLPHHLSGNWGGRDTGSGHRKQESVGTGRVWGQDAGEGQGREGAGWVGCRKEKRARGRLRVEKVAVWVGAGREIKKGEGKGRARGRKQGRKGRGGNWGRAGRWGGELGQEMREGVGGTGCSA